MVRLPVGLEAIGGCGRHRHRPRRRDRWHPNRRVLESRGYPPRVGLIEQGYQTLGATVCGTKLCLGCAACLSEWHSSKPRSVAGFSLLVGAGCPYRGRILRPMLSLSLDRDSGLSAG